MPKVSVGIRTMDNRARFLRQSITGVLRQSVEDLEVFVSDNGPTTDTAALVASFGDSRLT